MGIGDIVSVNGLPVKGTAIEIINAPIISSDFSPGAAIGDFPGGPTATSWDLGFLTPDGNVVGTRALHGQGTLDTVRPPGAPKEITGGSLFSVTGGTGAFFGARGYLLKADARRDCILEVSARFDVRIARARCVRPLLSP